MLIAGNNSGISNVINKYLPSYDLERVEPLIDKMLSDRTTPIEGYGGGGRKNIRLTSVEAAVQYLKDNDGNVPFGYD